MSKYIDPMLYEWMPFKNISVTNVVEAISFKKRIKHILFWWKKEN